MARWPESTSPAPDLRWNKVQRIRESIRLDTYENERIIDLTIERIQNDLGDR